MMSIQLVLTPVFLHVALTLCLLGWTGAARAAALRRREVRMADIALGQQAWPAKVTQIGNCYANQLQAPVLFYAATAFAMITRQADTIFVILAFVFVTLRYAHAAEHVTRNFVPRRFFLFAAGVGALGAMWIWLAIKVLTA
jgi:hypothetical protein